MEEEIKQSEYLLMIQRLLRDVKYGTITIIVQDGKIVQIEKSEKIRLKN